MSRITLTNRLTIANPYQDSVSDYVAIWNPTTKEIGWLSKSALFSDASPQYNKITSQFGFTLVGQILTINPNWTWLIKRNNYTNISNVIFNIPLTSAPGMKRTDIVVANNNNSFTRLSGVESLSNPIAPAFLQPGLIATTIQVEYDSVSVTPPPDLSGYATTEYVHDSQDNIVRVFYIWEGSLPDSYTKNDICEYILSSPENERTILETDSKWNIVVFNISGEDIAIYEVLNTGKGAITEIVSDNLLLLWSLPTDFPILTFDDVLKNGNITEEHAFFTNPFYPNQQAELSYDRLYITDSDNGQYATLDSGGAAAGDMDTGKHSSLIPSGVYINGNSLERNPASTSIGQIYLPITSSPDSEPLPITLAVDLGYIPENIANKGIPLGYAPLDSNNKVPLIHINDALLGNVNYQGLWNQNTNTPTLTSTAETKGHYYICSGPTESIVFGLKFNTGDWIISNGVIWEKVDNTDAVPTVFGRTGPISALAGDYNTGLVTEVANKNYQTDNQKLFNDATSSIQTQLNSKQAQLNGTGLVRMTGTTVSYDNNSYALVSQLHNAVTLGTPNGLSLAIQVLSLALASSTTTGALSLTDWNTFNNKQNALVNPITGTGTAGQVSFWSGANTQLGTDELFWDNTNKRLIINNTSGSTVDVTASANVGVSNQFVLSKNISGIPTQRWLMRASVASETGSNVGSDFAIDSRTDTGAVLNTPFFIKRSTGNIGIDNILPTEKLHVNGRVASKIGGFLIEKVTNGTSATPIFEKIIQYGQDTDASYISGGNSFTTNTGTLLKFTVNATTGLNTPIDAMLINSIGEVLIGTTASVGSKLAVKGTANLFSLQGTTAIAETQYISFLDSAATRRAYVGFGNAVTDNFYINNDEVGGHIVLNPTTTGNVGIGTLTPTLAKLQVAGNILATTEIVAGLDSGSNTGLAVNGSAGTIRGLGFRTAGLNRFILKIDNTSESGSDVGSDFRFSSYTDAGVLKSDLIFIKRSTGNIGVGLTPTTTATDKLQVNGNITANAATAANHVVIKSQLDAYVPSGVVLTTTNQFGITGDKAIVNTSATPGRWRAITDASATYEGLVSSSQSSTYAGFLAGSADNSTAIEVRTTGNNSTGLLIQPTQNNPTPGRMLVLSNKKAVNLAVDTATPLTVLRDTVTVASISDLGYVTAAKFIATNNITSFLEASIQISNTNTSNGIFVTNSSSGVGSRVTNSSSGFGSFIQNESSGIALVIDGITASSGSLIVGRNNGADTFALSKIGAVKAASFALNALNTAPASATAAGVLGEIRYDATFMYVCTATNVWKRSALVTW